MADRYWVGGSGTWDATTTTNWSTASGQPGGASAPTLNDNVYFDSGSGSTFTVTIGTNAVCADFNVVSGVVGMTLTGATTARLSIYGSLAFPASGLSVTLPNASAITFAATTTGKTITTNAVSIACSVVFNGVGGGWTLGSAWTTTYVMTFSAGTLNTSNYNLTVGFFNPNAPTNIFVLNAGSSVLTFTGSSGIGGTGWGTISSSYTNFSITGTYTIQATGAGALFCGGGLTYYNVIFPTNTSSFHSLYGAATFGSLTFGAKSPGVGTPGVILYNNITVTGTFTTQSGNTTPQARIRFVSSSLGQQRTLSVGAYSGMFAVDFQDINWVGPTLDDTARTLYLGDLLGNSGITFSAGRTSYLKNSGNWFDNNIFSNQSGGTANNQYFPLAQDAVILDNNSASPLYFNNTANNVYSFDASGRTTSFTLGTNGSLEVYGGDLKMSSAIVSAGGTGSYVFVGRNGIQNFYSNGYAAGTGNYTISALNGIVRLQDNASTGNFLTLNYGTLDLNNFTFTCNIFNSNNTNVRAILFGTGQITVTSGGGATAINVTPTNLTITGSANVVCTPSGAGAVYVWGGPTSSTEDNSINLKITGSATNVYTGGSSGSTTRYWRSIDLSSFTGNWAAQVCLIYGDITLSSTTTNSAYGGVISVAQSLGGTLAKIASNGATLNQGLVIGTAGSNGTLRLQDNLSLATAISYLSGGTLDLNGKTLTAAAGLDMSNSARRTINFNNGTINCGAGWTATTSTNLSIVGVGTISMTSSSAKTFAGGGFSYSGITLNQGGTGALTISGSNKFSTMTNTAIGSVIFTSGTTNEFILFSLNGAAGNLLTLGATTTSQAIIKKIGNWLVGANSTNGGNNTGLTFTSDGTMDYLSISYINGNVLPLVYVTAGPMTATNGLRITA